VKGISSIYNPTPKGFRIYLMSVEGPAPTPAFANEKGWAIQWLGVEEGDIAGSTKPGNTQWKEYRGDNGVLHGIYVDIDTSSKKFKDTPQYLTSLYGMGWHGSIEGISAIYNVKNTGFRVYVRSDIDLTPDFANKQLWAVQWMAT
jgi:hypothetical protein